MYSPLVESTVNVDDVAMDGALSLSTHWVFKINRSLQKDFLVPGLNPVGKTFCTTCSFLHS